MINFDNYEFRCHALSNIIPNQKTKKYTKTHLSYLRLLVSQEISNKRDEIHSKYFDKGIVLEGEATKMVQLVFYKETMALGDLEKPQRVSNGWITGEADIEMSDAITDTKVSYNRNSFLGAGLKDEYNWQLKGYGWLYGKSSLRLFYALLSLPDFLLDREYKSLLYSKDHVFSGEEDPEYARLCEKIKIDNTYDHLELWERFRVFNTTVTDEDIVIIKQSVIMARKQMNIFAKEYFEDCERNKKLLI